MRKILLIILILAGLVVIFALLNSGQKNERKTNPLFSRPNQLKAKLIDSKKSISKNLDIEKRVYSESLHGGRAVFIGPYRAELALYRDDNKGNVAVGLFLANTLGMPVYPKNTKVFLILKDKTEKEMQVVKNGFLLAEMEDFSLPADIGLIGTLNGKKFSVNIKINSFRKEIINKKIEK